MKRFLLGSILALALLGCTKEDDAITAPPKDYTSFLANTGNFFRGQLSGNYFSWSFGINQYQMSGGYDTAALRTVSFGLNSMDRTTWFNLYSPATTRRRPPGAGRCSASVKRSSGSWEAISTSKYIRTATAILPTVPIVTANWKY